MINRKQSKVRILSVLVLVLVSIGCSKDDDQTFITPVGNKAPVISAQTFTVKEDVAEDTVIGTVTATDPEKKTLTFALTQNSGDLFELTSTGELSLAAGKKLDFDTMASHTLTAEVSDGTTTASAAITVTVERVGAAFITTWKTTKANEEITMEINEQFTYDYTIDWGDGTVDNNQTTSPKHNYATAGTYTVSISGTFPEFRITNESREALETIEQWGDNQWESFYAAFLGAVNMTYNATDIPNLSKVTDLSYMFSGCNSFNGDLNNWDVSSITRMIYMFYDCSEFNSDLNNWDVSSVTNMGYMFYSCHEFNSDLNNWDVSSVTSMYKMFYSCNKFNSDLNNWDVSSVTNMSEMFFSCVEFTSDLNNWDVSSVTSMYKMFYGSQKFNSDLNNWDVSNVVEMAEMFVEATSFNGDISDWDVSKVINMAAMFWDATSFNGDISDWNIQNVKKMNVMLNNTNISTANYDALLTKWAALPNLQSNVSLGAQGLTYCDRGIAGRTSLINDKGWAISGDSECPR